MPLGDVDRLHASNEARAHVMTQAQLLDELEATFSDLQLSDYERRRFTVLLRETQPPEEGLRQLRNAAFVMMREQLTESKHHHALKLLEGIVRSLDLTREPKTTAHNSVYFSPGNSCRNVIIRHLNNAKKRVDICVFTITDDDIANAIADAHQRGVQVRIISDNGKAYDPGSDVYALQQKGIALVLDCTPAHMHHKFALFDNEWLINGSYNWTRSASNENEENIVLSNDPTLLNDFGELFNNLWRQFQ
jgi:phosphatidylserine/phosphatidylglycerophosphate/cardiolipin synthase-like enzyme